ncbi:MAG: crossover junction endodeoxyribonuclease RuvC [Planctomycetota bacterium]|jgi:crossover junction endodeoxyribonuclease RuvC
MRILGIDPGLQVCGYACLETGAEREKLIEAGVIRTAGGAAIEEKLNRIAEDTESLLKSFRPGVVAVEELYAHYAHPRTAILMGHARGVILQKCAEVAIEVRSFSATRIKKSITGNGKLPEPSDVADAIATAMCCANSMKNVSMRISR